MITLTKKDKSTEQDPITALEVLSSGFGMSMVENGSHDTCEILARMLKIAATSIKTGEFNLVDETGYVKVVFKCAEPESLPQQKH